MFLYTYLDLSRCTKGPLVSDTVALSMFRASDRSISRGGAAGGWFVRVVVGRVMSETGAGVTVPMWLSRNNRSTTRWALSAARP